MIEIIFIPTYRRINKQITYDRLPDKWKKRTILVVAPDEYQALKKLGYNVLSCPVQGKAPEGKNPNDYGISATREWIIKQAGNRKFAVLDDDLVDFVYTARPSERSSYRLVNNIINSGKPEKGFETSFDTMMDLMSEWLDEFVTVGLEVTWNPPMETDYQDCWRQTTNHFINGSTFPKENIDYRGIALAEDYYTLLQLLTKGYKNRVSLRYRIRPGLTQADGGCEEYRTLEKHNDSMKKLQADFPDFVTLKEKKTKTGKWKDIVKLAAMIQWKQAWKSSQKTKTHDNAINTFFE